MALNDVGCIVWEQWYWLAQQYPYVTLDTFIVMPNHVHGILIINHPEGVDRVLAHDISPLLVEGLPEAGGNPEEFDLFRLIRAFKSRCSKKIHEHGELNFQWQPSCYERVIVEELTYEKVKNYILTNPLRWHRDRNNV